MSTLHTVARDGLVAAWSDPSVASVAGIAASVWPNRVLKGNREGLISQLHRGLLPAVEIYQVDDHWKAMGDVTLGLVTSRWGIRVHVGSFDQIQGEELARNVAYAGLIKARANPYFTIGEETIAGFGDSPLGYTIEIQFDVQNAMDRRTFETDFTGSGGGLPPDGGTVGGIRTELSFNSAFPFAILALPAGQAVAETKVDMEIPFTDGASVIQVGVAANHDLLMAAGDVDETTTNTYEKESDLVGPATIYVYCDPKTSTAGKFVVQILTTMAQ